MSQARTRKVTIALDSAGSVTVLREVAKSLGYLIPTGPMAFEGNLSTMLSALASGELDAGELGEALAAVRVSIADDAPELT